VEGGADLLNAAIEIEIVHDPSSVSGSPFQLFSVTNGSISARMMKNLTKTPVASTHAKPPELKKLSDGLYTIAGYTPPQEVSPGEIERIIRELLTPVRISEKD
jgi:hypothetical protein